MQGRLLREGHTGGQPSALIDIAGVTHSRFYTARWVPRNVIEVGPPVKELKDWTIQISGLGTRFQNESKYQPSEPPDNTPFGKTVHAMINAIYHEQFPFISPVLYKDIDEFGGTDAISKAIIDGVKLAGLYDAFNVPDFNISQLKAAASCTLPTNRSHVLAGVYARWSKTRATMPESVWTPNTTYLYVGHSKNMDSRHATHPYSTSSYGILNRNADVRAFALCLLPEESHKIFLYLAEQVLMCMLQSFRKGVYSSSYDSKYVEMVHQAKIMVSLSNQVFAITKWTGAQQRPSFCVGQGANLSLPVVEYSQMRETLWVREDTHAAHPETGQTMPMAIFRRSTPITYSVSGSSESGELRFFVFQFPVFRLACSPVAQDKPAIGQACQAIIEIRKDKLPHPRSFSRLADIPRFQNWDQARSVALRIEWEDLKQPGKWRTQYLSRSFTTLRNDNIPASFEAYAKSIEILQCMLHNRPRQIPSWIVQPRYANVVMAVYNYMDHTITFRAVGDQDRVPIKSCARLLTDQIETEMRNPKYQLRQVGQIPPERGTTTPRCDVCKMLKSSDVKCTPNSNGVCSRCLSFGFPRCSWTPDVFQQNQCAHIIRGELYSKRSCVSLCMPC